jgi:transcriptional regulator with XRE-family HTH domain
MLRNWRRRRGMSLLDLAQEADVSGRRLSRIEAGDFTPDRDGLLALAERLALPLRERNVLLLAAGHQPEFQERNFHSPAMAATRRGVDTFLTALEPNPAMAIDRHWDILSANRAVASLVAGAGTALLRPPVNLLRLILHPAGLAPRIINLRRWRGHVIRRLQREIDLNNDLGLIDLLDEIRDYPTPPADECAEAPLNAVAVPLQLAAVEGTLTLIGTSTRYCAPRCVALAELTIEAFLPADLRTAEILHGFAAHPLADRSAA